MVSSRTMGFACAATAPVGLRRPSCGAAGRVGIYHRRTHLPHQNEHHFEQRMNEEFIQFDVKQRAGGGIYLYFRFIFISDSFIFKTHAAGPPLPRIVK